MNAGRHALGWLVAGNAAGLWLSLLLLFPGLNIGEWTYGRWMPVHLNVQLYGWAALPLVGWLLSIYGVPRRWAEAATWAWTAALAAGVLSWLGGATSGKIFLDWKGGPRLAFVAALAFLWCVLAAGWSATAETALAILRYARQRLAPYKRIRRIEFGSLPKTISGKIRRVELRGSEDNRAGARTELEFWEDDFPDLKVGSRS